MAIKTQWQSVIFVACMIMLAMMSGSVRADEVPLITGEHWTKSSEQLKKAYLVGIANVVQVETAYAGSNPPAEAQPWTSWRRRKRYGRRDGCEGARDQP